VLIQALRDAGFARVTLLDRRRNARTGHEASEVVLIKAER
jgi:hypothetical protein